MGLPTTFLFLALASVGCLQTANAERRLLQSYLETFPPYGCTRDQQQSRFRLDPGYTVSGNRVCMTVRVVNCFKPGAACCDPKIDANKIALDVNIECRNAISGITVNGRPSLAPTFDPYGADNSKAVYKLTGLSLNLSNADGAVPLPSEPLPSKPCATKSQATFSFPSKPNVSEQSIVAGTVYSDPNHFHLLPILRMQTIPFRPGSLRI
ncbi:hypothetical protein VOLCADRAFT_99730 [Volvox carteri f. nagariensis]|uniref:Pherophorin domain-containing protein n=1 Tax=Volvox carteri f. nagariensis TaxID=3068 RepID=D8UIH8_VOLCA|nr:uncharacterized protein VOLCADRAFT_99730 [Volvox carteri f. nagariensis]EFJ40455.1 hypothetical protein VOLCADRAFT_99730 [Volvox carteri f. nagariensis]|eukprot:XP_002958455.1 hypothetical protein VOLCADRAFT_99730 [Volvox carteri f. nagariensis]